MSKPLTVGRRPLLVAVVVVVVVGLVGYLIGRGSAGGGASSAPSIAPSAPAAPSGPASEVPPGPVQQPGATQAGATQSPAGQPSVAQSGATQSGATQTGATQTGATQSGAAQSGGTQSAPAGASSAPGVGLTAGQTLSGVAGGSTQAAEDFGALRGKPVQVIVNYASVESWAAMDALSTNGLLYRGTPSSIHRVFSLPLIPSDNSSTLQDGAAGKDDQYFRSFAQQLVTGGQAKATLRIGWEMTGNWFAWNGQKDPTDWVLAYRKAVDAMKSVPGQQFTFDWNVQLGFADPEPLYPGDAWVDIIGVDYYDVSFDGDFLPTDHEKVWQHFLDQPKGLTWLAAFAKTHGKRMSFPEWGLSNRCDGHGGDDDPYFIQQMHDWIASHDVAYEGYYNSHDAGVCATFDFTSGQFPQSEVLYKKLFGGSA